MKNIRKMAALILALLLLAGSAAAEWRPSGENTQRFIKLLKLLDATVDPDVQADKKAIGRTLEKIRQESADDYDVAGAIVDHWNAVVGDKKYPMYAYKKGQEKAAALEESGLEFSGKHAFVVLGYQLHDGKMQKELKGRCNAAAAAARSYPDAILVTTGGATGSGNPENHTEAGLMKDYLAEQGIDESRIFTDPDAMTTLENAENVIRILEEQGIESYTIVTSNYHQRWAQIVFNGVAAIREKDTGYRLQMVGNYNYMAMPTASRTHSVRIGLNQLKTLFRRYEADGAE